MPETVNDELLDAAVRHQVFLGRYATGLVRRIVKLLNEADADLVGQIIAKDPQNASGTWSVRRLQRLLDAIREINRDAYNSLRKRARQELVELAAYEADFNARAIAAQMPIDLDIVRPTRQLLRAAVTDRPIHGVLLKGWIENLSNTRQRQLEQAIRLGLVEGETIDQIVRRVRGTKARQFRDGILDLNRRHAEAFVRTAVNHTATAARETLYTENDDLVKSVKWVSTLDSRTTPICRARDGKVFPVDEGPRPPAHVGCRSTTSPVLKSWRDLGFDLDELSAGERASMNGQVPADLTYGPWLKRQPVDFIDDVLGKTKSKLFRNGDLPIERFVDNRGKELTLAELRQRESAAFERAGI